MKVHATVLLAFCTIALTLTTWTTAAEPEHLNVYFGTSATGPLGGVYRARLDLATGKLDGLALAGAAENASFVVLHPTKPRLYACTARGTVRAFSIDPVTGGLATFGEQSSTGKGPCHVSLDPAGRHLFVANYGDGSAACLPLADDGNLLAASSRVENSGSGPNTKRQAGPHAHSINLDAAGRYAFVADLGTDQVRIYKFDGQRGALEPHGSVAMAPGAGPRHFTFHPTGRFAYAINELDSTVTAMSYDAAQGKLRIIETVSTLPVEFSGVNTTAEVRVHPSGKFLYGSNRGHDSIAMFRIDESTGKLTSLGQQSTGGTVPRNFGIDPTGKYLLVAHQKSGDVVVFAIDAASGELKPTGQKLDVPLPTCVVFMR